MARLCSSGVCPMLPCNMANWKGMGRIKASRVCALGLGFPCTCASANDWHDHMHLHSLSLGGSTKETVDG